MVNVDGLRIDIKNGSGWIISLQSLYRSTLKLCEQWTQGRKEYKQKVADEQEENLQGLKKFYRFMCVIEWKTYLRLWPSSLI